MLGGAPRRRSSLLADREAGGEILEERVVVVGAGGMIVELAVASVAAILWSRTGEGTILHAVSYNIMIVASVS